MDQDIKGDVVLNALYLEDSPRDFEIVRELLTDAGYDLHMDRVETETDFISALSSRKYDIILSDFTLPGFDGFGSLRLRNEMCPDVPFICVSGMIGEEKAIELIRRGAVDYVLKDRLDRLPFSVKRALDEVHEKEAHKLADEELRTHQLELKMQNEELRLAQLELEVSKTRYFDLYDLAPVGYLTLSEKKLVLETNLAAARILGMVKSALIKQPLSRFILPEDRDIYYRYLKLLTETGEATRALEIRMVRQDETMVWARVEVTTAQDSEANLLYRVVISDITERKQTEVALQENEYFLNTLLNSIPIPVFYKDRDGRYLGFNKAFETFFGAKKEQLIGKTVFDINPPEHAEIYHTKDVELFENGNTQYYESQIKTALGQTRDVIFNKAIFTNIQGIVSGQIGAILDITDRKLAEEQIKASLREKEVLIKEIHHRVKNNLSVVISLLSMQSNKIENKEQARAAFNESRDRIYSMALVHQKLYEKTDLSHIDMESYMHDISSRLKGIYAPDRDITIESNAKDVSLDITLAVPVGLILNELITNSLKHAFPDNREGSITLSLSLKDTSYRLLVADNGIGLPEDIRVDASETFGMEIVHLLTGQIDGTLDIQRDKGTRFTITFPREDTKE